MCVSSKNKPSKGFLALCIVGSTVLCAVTFMGIRSRFVPPTPKSQVTKGKAVSVYVDDGTGVYRANEDGTFPTTGYVLNTELSGCANGGVLSQNPETKKISLSVSGSDQCHVYFDKENLALKTLQALNLVSRGVRTDFDNPAPLLTSYTDDNFSGSVNSRTQSSTYQGAYFTYADSYTFNTSTGTYTLTNPQVCKYSECYSSLANKYIVSISGSPMMTARPSSNISTIYKVTGSTTLDKLYYITSSKSPVYDYSGEGVYEMEDDYGTSYYFRGSAENNYVKFGKWRDDEPDVYVGYGGPVVSGGDYPAAKNYKTLSACQADAQYKYNCTLVQRAGKDMYWRIVRINGDGSLRMIYSGTQTYANRNQGDDSFISCGQVFNANSNDAKYVGYMYSPSGTTASTNKEVAQKNVVSSNIKIALEDWYANNLETNYGQYISKDAVYCYDRSTPGKSATGWTDDTGLGYGTNKVAFGATARTGVWNSATTASAPSFICTQNNDKFTVEGATIGNKALSKPVGLISADEILAAGSGKYKTASDYYLKRKLFYWSGSPYSYDASATIFDVSPLSNISSGGVSAEDIAVAPVINLTPEYAKTLVGDGTISSPYHS